MADREARGIASDPLVRRALHDANGQLSVAVLHLGLLLEGEPLEESARDSLQEALDACRSAAASLQSLWRRLDSPSGPSGATSPTT
jgi:hypothetical protein